MIKLDDLCERQKLNIKLGLLQYDYITKHKGQDDSNFRKAYTDFYLSSQGIFYYKKNQNIYFNKLKNMNKNKNNYKFDFEEYKNERDKDKYLENNVYNHLMCINNELKSFIEKVDTSKPNNTKEDDVKILGKNQFSFSTKMLHTICDNYPIFDRLVYEYLKKNEKLQLKWYNRGKSDAQEIMKQDYKELINWYSKFIDSEEGKDCTNKFDEEFDSFMKNNNIQISPIKKIDFMIIAFKS